MDIPIRGGVLTVSGGPYKAGDMPPEGYSDWHEWAAVQHKAGLRQVRCGRCMKVWYPQELSHIIDVKMCSLTKHGPADVRRESPVCKKCAGNDCL